MTPDGAGPTRKSTHAIAQVWVWGGGDCSELWDISWSLTSRKAMGLEVEFHFWAVDSVSHACAMEPQ